MCCSVNPLVGVQGAALVRRSFFYWKVTMPFDRLLRDEFIEALNELPENENSWWHKLVTHETLRLSARLDRLEKHQGLRPENFRSEPPFYGLTPASGLHVLKNGWNQVESMSEQCSWLHDELGLALEVTHRMAPTRNAAQGFQLEERINQPRPQNGEERQLEWDLYNQYKLTNNNQSDNPFWTRLVGFQVPLYDNILHDGWDKIDLVGIDYEGLPVVGELKKGSSTEKPLRPLLEAAGYAIALKNVWPTFYTELQAVLIQHNINQTVIQNPAKFRLLILAPPEYWQRILETEAITSAKWEAFSNLVSALNQNGFPVSFAQVVNNQVVPVPNFPPQFN